VLLAICKREMLLFSHLAYVYFRHYFQLRLHSVSPFQKNLKKNSPQK
jgi:hypothetical protein